jgi:hypothetical protein
MKRKNGGDSCRPENSYFSDYIQFKKYQLKYLQVFESPINETITVNDNPGPVCTVHEKKKKTVAVVVALKSG